MGSAFKAAFQTMENTDELNHGDVFQAYEKIKAAGYTAVEISGHVKCTENFVRQTRRAQECLGIEVAAISASVSFDESSVKDPLKIVLPRDIDKAVRLCRSLGCRFVRFASLPVETFVSEQAIRDYFEKLEMLSCELKDMGIILCAHNHFRECVPLFGRNSLEWALELAPDLCFEFDVYGMQIGGLNLIKMTEKMSGRMPLLHFEDIAVDITTGKSTLNAVHGAPLGEGNINVTDVCEAADKADNRYFIIEICDLQGKDPYEMMKIAADNLKKLGYADRF